MAHMWQDYYDSRKDEIVSFDSDGEVDADDEDAMMVNDRNPREPDGLFLDKDAANLQVPYHDEYDDEMVGDMTYALTQDKGLGNNYTSPRSQHQKFSLNDDSLPYVNNLHSLRKVQPDKIKIYKFRTVVLVVLLIFGLGMTLGFVLRDEEDRLENPATHPAAGPVAPPIEPPVAAPVADVAPVAPPVQKEEPVAPVGGQESPVLPPVQPPVTPPVMPPVTPPVGEPAREQPSKAEFPGMNTDDSLSMAEVRDFLVKLSVSDKTQLNTEGTPQYKALQWIAAEDGANLPIPEESDLDAVYKYVQRYVMALNYFATDGPNWKHTLNFLGEQSICGWLDYVGDISHKKHNTGIGCDVDKNIQIFSLDFMDMQGEIPTENGLLTTLKEFNVAGNSLHGELPTELCQLTSLSVFAIDKNSIEGALPACFSKLTNMEGLGLGDNVMTGQLPQLGSFPNLMQLLINNNDFQGQLDISNMPHLEILDVKHNEFTGTVDGDMLGNLKNLKYVDMSDNRFTSTEFPDFVFDFPHLEVLDISSNTMKGQIPAKIKENAVMRYLAVHSNNLNGEIAYSLKNLTALTHINIGGNDFSGRFPLHLGMLRGLEVLYMPDLPLLDEGRMPEEFLDLDKLKILSLRNTNRNYVLPQEFAVLKYLEYLDVSNNNLSGSLPLAWGDDFIYMRVLILSGNPLLKGPIPETFKKMGSLGQLFVQGTGLEEGLLRDLCSTMILAEGYESIVATCNLVDTDCPCCKCCKENDVGCGYDMIDIYDQAWDAEFRLGNTPVRVR